MANEVEIRITSSDKSGPGFASAEQRANGLGSTLKRVAGIAAGFLVGAAVVGGFQKFKAYAQESVTAASDLGESLNAVSKVFGDNAKQVLEWGKQNASAFGLSQRAFNQMATPLGAMLKNAGLDMDDVADRTIELTKRAADMASVFNTDVDVALDAIQAGLRGESDPLEKFGVGLSEAAVQAQALADTGKKAASSLTTQEKMTARLNLIMKQTKDTAGDFRGTSDGLANSQRIAAARAEDLQAVIGQKLIPVVQLWNKVKLGVTETLATRVVPAVAAAAVWIGATLPRAIDAVKAGFAAAAAPIGAFHNGMEAVKEEIAPLGKMITAAKDGLGPLAPVIAGVGASGKAMADGFAPLKPLINDFVDMGPMVGETAKLMGDGFKPLGPLIKGAAGEAERSGLERFFYGVGKAVGETVLFVRRNWATWVDWGQKVGGAVRTVTGFVRSFVAGLQRLDEMSGGAVLVPLAAGIAAIVIAVKAWAAAQLLLNLAMAANPVGIVVLAIVGLAVALVMAWRRSEKFREVVTLVFKGVALFVLGAVEKLVNGVMMFFGAIIHGAATAFGWLPGIGDKLKAADKAFQEMRTKVAQKFRDMRESVNGLGSALNNVGRGRTITVRIRDQATGALRNITREISAATGKAYSFTVGLQREGSPKGNATGGIIGAATGGVHGGLRWVGEQGRELVRLPYGSTVYPHGQSEAMAAASSGPVVVQLRFGSAGGGRFDDLFKAFMRQWVRVEGGGNVQAVFD